MEFRDEEMRLERRLTSGRYPASGGRHIGVRGESA
jgi:hypothetical protein